MEPRFQNRDGAATSSGSWSYLYAEDCEEMYADNQPPREKGKAGTKHPWGAPRNANTAALIDYTVTKIYKGENGEELKDDGAGDLGLGLPEPADYEDLGACEGMLG